MFHQFLTRLDQHILYLRDERSKAYLAGVPEFGEGLWNTVDGIHCLVH